MASDHIASGVTAQGQIGGIDANKFTGSIDWIPLTLVSAWQSSSSTKTVRTTTGGPAVPATFTTPVIEFDTGDPGLIALPTPDWNVLTNAVGAFQDASNNWWFPCNSTITINFHGSQNRDYPVALADPTQPNSSRPGFCAATGNDEGVSTNW